jgi:hypothetical protein
VKWPTSINCWTHSDIRYCEHTIAYAVFFCRARSSNEFRLQARTGKERCSNSAPVAAKATCTNKVPVSTTTVRWYGLSRYFDINADMNWIDKSQVKPKTLLNAPKNPDRKVVVVPFREETNPTEQTHQRDKLPPASPPIATQVDIEDTLLSGGGGCVAVARTTMLERIRAAAGLGGAAATATVAEFHQYLVRLRAEEDGPFQCLVAALLRFKSPHHHLSTQSRRASPAYRAPPAPC